MEQLYHMLTSVYGTEHNGDEMTKDYVCLEMYRRNSVKRKFVE